jgi:predicted transcriptional regulator
MDVHLAVFQIYQHRVGDAVEARIDEIAARVVRHPGFDPLDQELHLRLVHELAPDDDEHFAEQAHNAVWALVHENGMIQQAKGDLGSVAHAFFTGLTAREVDLLSYADWATREATVSVAYPALSKAQLNAVAHHLRDLLRASRSERELRFATVARLLRESGLSKREVADSLGIKQVQMSNAVRESPEDVSLAPDDYLRDLVVDFELDESLPSSATVLAERAEARAASHHAAEEVESRISDLADEVLTTFDRRAKDLYAQMARVDKERVIAARCPDADTDVAELVASRVGELVNGADQSDLRARYATAVRALTRRGATHAEAARHLGISPQRAEGITGAVPQDIDLAPDDYLREVIDSFPGSRTP